MLERKAKGQFEAWFASSPSKALLVKGARQVGKSYLVNVFANDAFEHVVTFDLIEDTSVRDSFLAAKSADDLLMRMTIAATEPMVAGSTVVVIDEVQQCPQVVTFIKYLVQRGDFRYILTGSLLGVELEGIDSLPVGYVEQIQMYPLDFEEFCWANGVAATAFDLLRDCLEQERELPDYLYARLLDLFHQYVVVGGMPDAVNAFLATRNIDEVRRIHHDLNSLYRDDIAKYAPPELRLIIRDIYDLIPSEVGSKNKRFKLSSIEGVKRFSQVTDHFLWLSEAGVALPVYNVAAPVTPLLIGEQRNLFKLFYLDTGMLMSSYSKKVAQGVFDGVVEGTFGMNMGAAFEGFVAQEMKAHGFRLRYFTSKKVGELDFVEETLDGDVLAIEVKSGKRYKSHAALDNALATKGYGIDRALVLAQCNLFRDGDILYLPIFMAGLLEP